MDNITHGIVGGWIMDAVLGKSQVQSDASRWKRNKIMIVGGLIANIPDIDFFMGKFISRDKPIDQFLFHRGYTHSLLFALIISLLVGRWGASKDAEKRPIWRWMVASFLTICVGHLFVDLMTSYGIRLLLPFSNETFSLNNIFVIDLIYTIPLIVLWLVYVFAKKQFSRYMIKCISRMRLIVYPLSTFAIQSHVKEVFVDSLDAQHIAHSRIFVTPEPLQAFLRHGLVQSGPGYYDAYYSLFDKNKNIARHYIPNNTIIRKELIDKPDVKEVEGFAQGRTSYEAGDGAITIGVLKMGSILGRERPATGNAAQFAFRVTASGDVLGQEGLGRFLGTSLSQVWHEHRKRVRGE